MRMSKLFEHAIIEVLKTVPSNFGLSEDALIYLDDVCHKMLVILIDKPFMYTVKDVEIRINNRCPRIMADCMNNAAAQLLNDFKISKKSNLVFPHHEIRSILQKRFPTVPVNNLVAYYISAALETNVAEILKFCGTYAEKLQQNTIKKIDVQNIMSVKAEETNMFAHADRDESCDASTLSYEDLVREFINNERQYKRSIEKIIFIFKKKLELITSNNDDTKVLLEFLENFESIHDITDTFLGYIDDVVEMSLPDNQTAFIGSCFQDLAIYKDFDAYLPYLEMLDLPKIRHAINNIVSYPSMIDICQKYNENYTFPCDFSEIFKYYLPKLILRPIQNLYSYFRYINNFIKVTPSEEDRNCFYQVQGLLVGLKDRLKSVSTALPEKSLNYLNGRARRIEANDKINQLKEILRNWLPDNEIKITCTEYFGEETVRILGNNQRMFERITFRFDGLLVLCKPIASAFTGSNSNFYYHVKDKIFLKKAFISDIQDADDLNYAFQIKTEEDKIFTIMTDSQKSKNEWMANLIIPSAKLPLERILNNTLLEMKQKHVMKLPDPIKYRFTTPDDDDNIVFDVNPVGPLSEIPSIRAATIDKLIEYLTYHVHANPKFVTTFLISYRIYLSPTKLLELLKDRFNIPVEHSNQKDFGTEAFKLERESIKRFQRHFVQPIKLRVLNVIRQWIKNHFFDFEHDHHHMLLQNLVRFLFLIKERSLQKWVKVILLKIQNKGIRAVEIKRKNSFAFNNQRPPLLKVEIERILAEIQRKNSFAFNHQPPNIIHHLEEDIPETEFHLLNLHPLELARQLTLLESSLYKTVQQSELIAWVTEDEDTKKFNAPNLLIVSSYTTNFTRWIEKSIVYAENYEERVAIVSRVIEVMMALRNLNNFNGVFAILSAIECSSVHRLKLTFQGIPKPLENILLECQDLQKDHLKHYVDKLRSINPPCVPFLGKFLTYLVSIMVGNTNYLPPEEKGMINFSKWIKVFNTTSEIQQYQNDVYCLKVDNKIRNFLKNLDPFPGSNFEEIEEKLFIQSFRIEPPNTTIPVKYPRKWPNLNLTSPGISPTPNFRKTSIRFRDFSIRSNRKGSVNHSEVEFSITNDNNTLPTEPKQEFYDEPPPLPPRKNLCRKPNKSF